MVEITPTEYDVIILGTGLTESIIAAALSRIGKTVLHLDTLDYYGEQWTSFTLAQLERLAAKGPPPTDGLYRPYLRDLVLENLVPPEEESTERQTTGEGGLDSSEVRQEGGPKGGEVRKESGPEGGANEVATGEKGEGEITAIAKDEPLKEEVSPTSTWTAAKFEKAKRRVNIDVTPKVCLSNGPMVDLIRSSNCSRYLSFKEVTRSFVFHNSTLLEAPCSREQVFNSKSLKILEKRLLMRFLSWALDLSLDSEDFTVWEGRLEEELYGEYKLTENLVRLVRGALVRAPSPTSLPAQTVIRAVQTYLRNVGIYGPIPYIFPVYGAAEISQAFVRYSAVFGSVYVLAMGVSRLDRDDQGQFCGVTLETGQQITGKHCILSPNYSDCAEDDGATPVYHGIYLTERSVRAVEQEGERDDVSLLYIPADPSLGVSQPVTGYEFGESSGVSAVGMYVVHLTAPDRADLERAAAAVVGDRPLYRITFTSLMGGARESRVEGGVIRTGRPIYCPGYAECIEEAERVFRLIEREGEFLPAAPDPEDYKWDEVEEEEEGSVKMMGGEEKSGEGEERSAAGEGVRDQTKKEKMSADHTVEEKSEQ